MTVNTKNVVVVAFLIIIAAGIGFVVGNQTKSKSPPLADLADKPPKDTEPGAPDADIDHKSDDELSARLSKIMLPDEEYNKLGDAIYQTAMSLLMAQAQGSGVEVNPSIEQELKDSIAKKYSRQYFTDMNAISMKELSKADLTAILAFYNTEPGKKFLELSPKIIESTMASVQADLSKWLPETVDAVLTKLKGGKAGEATENPKVNTKETPGKEEPVFKDKAELDS